MKWLMLFHLFLRVVLCIAFPADSGTDGEVVTSNNPFDAGEVTECRQPSTNFCSIDYEVPDSIAALAEVIEYEISGKLTGLGGTPNFDSCHPVLMEAMCAYRFPRCDADGTNVVMSSLPNCTQRIDAACTFPHVRSLIEAEGVCALQETTVQLDSCEPAKDFPGWDQLEHCSSVVDDSTRVTAWMMQYMNMTNLELRQKLAPNTALSSLWNPSTCSEGASLYFCQFYGHCTDRGRIELSNSEGFCDTVVSW